MKRKKFSLQAILQLREYKEYQELQMFFDVSKNDDIMAANIAEYSRQQTALGESLKEQIDFHVIKEVHKTIALYEEKKRFLIAEREKMRESIEKAKEKYDKAYKNAESIRILKNIHEQKQNKENYKKYIEEIQERATWQK